jgi:hypothetical protein
VTKPVDARRLVTLVMALATQGWMALPEDSRGDGAGLSDVSA